MKWNLKLIYESEKELEEDLKSLENDIKKLESLKGKLASKDGFINYVKIDEKISRRIDNLYAYAHMNHDLNQKDSKSSELYSRIYSKYTDLISRTSWVQPELLSIGEETILGFCKDKDLSCAEFQMKKLFHLNAHVKSAEIEEVMAQYNSALSEYTKLYNNLCVADNHSVSVEFSNHEQVELNLSNYTYYLATLENQDDRKLAFEKIYEFFRNHKSTLASIYNGIMQSEYAEAKNRGYESILDSHLYRNNIDKSVYLSLIETAKENNGPLLKYLELRKKHFNLKEYHTYDRLLSFSQSKKEYPYLEAKELVLDACRGMGDDFYSKALKVLEDGRVDVEIADGKRTGAYSASAFDKGAFILLNHTKSMNDAFTLAHETGHSIHTLYSFENQPYQNSGYEIFVAEIASTFNEQLFLDSLLSKTTDKNERIALLEQSINGLVATFYRQTLFAEYELCAHKLVEDHIPVTEEALSNIMSKLYKSYYGIDLDTEPLKKLVWAYIPHFFGSPFYVYQYATSFSASLAIYERVKNEVPGAKENYINMLSSGGSDYPVELVKKAGVDLTKKDSFMAVVHRLDELVDILKKELGE